MRIECWIRFCFSFSFAFSLACLDWMDWFHLLFHLTCLSLSHFPSFLHSFLFYLSIFVSQVTQRASASASSPAFLFIYSVLFHLSSSAFGFVFICFVIVCFCSPLAKLNFGFWTGFPRLFSLLELFLEHGSNWIGLNWTGLNSTELNRFEFKVMLCD